MKRSWRTCLEIVRQRWEALCDRVRARARRWPSFLPLSLRSRLPRGHQASRHEYVEFEGAAGASARFHLRLHQAPLRGIPDEGTVRQRVGAHGADVLRQAQRESQRRMERGEIFIPLAAICAHGGSVVAHFVEATKEAGEPRPVSIVEMTPRIATLTGNRTLLSRQRATKEMS